MLCSSPGHSWHKIRPIICAIVLLYPIPVVEEAFRDIFSPLCPCY